MKRSFQRFPRFAEIEFEFWMSVPVVFQANSVLPNTFLFCFSENILDTWVIDSVSCLLPTPGLTVSILLLNCFWRSLSVQQIICHTVVTRDAIAMAMGGRGLWVNIVFVTITMLILSSASVISNEPNEWIMWTSLRRSHLTLHNVSDALNCVKLNPLMFVKQHMTSAVCFCQEISEERIYFWKGVWFSNWSY